MQVRSRRRSHFADTPFNVTDTRGWWQVRSTGDDIKDERLGYRFALEYLALEEADTGGPGHLQLIVEAMPRNLGPIEISFLTLISYAAGADADKARRVSAYWDSRMAQVAAQVSA